MCKPGQKLVFCTCGPVSPLPKKKVIALQQQAKALAALQTSKEEYEKTVYKWTLYKYMNRRGRGELVMGDMYAPVKQIGDSLRAFDVMHQLNEGCQFDFDFEPTDGDSIHISKGYKYHELEEHKRSPISNRSMSFVFEKGEWYFGYIHSAEHKIRFWKSGEMNVVGRL